jgi:hypothetical protein
MAAKRTETGQANRYRIVAAEAHSWSSLLLEDERGGHVLYVVGTNAPTKVPARAVSELLARRAYRPWRGDQSWTALDQLPIHSRTGEAPLDRPAPAAVDAGAVVGDAQSA